MTSPKPAITRHPVRLSYDADRDALHVCEYGAVAEERMEGQCVAIEDRLRFFLRHRGGPVIGFAIDGLASLKFEGGSVDLWGAPGFRVPVLGLAEASVGEIALRARTTLGDRSTADVAAKARGRAADHPADAERAYREALDAGELRAHLWIACALTAQGRYAGAYDHARIFTELAPRNSWAWAWLGRICVELGDVEEARKALRRAVSLERRGSYPTPARQVLRSLA